ncbi:efflux RND transporter periplasmic adaptor subunit [Litoreibacter roseus]|uniref:Hemolysin D n=1 Tax=Litoreibacter roseus TaxID=2601869 RepID=A0A6N6JEQ6_9RHOB|nr:HlyD family efflux transporter periplasmic adaptor subunit [Litoreibacter roseus]GFE64833.1 hemolysin D [Litoreibacter roseus]
MRFFRRSLVGLVLLCATVGLLALAGKSIFDAVSVSLSEEGPGQQTGERVFSVNVLPIEPDVISPVLTSFGEIRSRRTLDIRAPIEGRIIELSPEFEEGGRVTAGDLLARINPADAQTAVDVSRTDLVEAQSDLRDAERALVLARDELVAAEDQAELRARALRRQEDLRSRGVGTEAAVETAELEASSALQAVLSRRQSVQQNEARIDQARTLVERREINLANAERLLAETEIFAAFDGRLADVTVTSGGIVATNERLAQLVDPTTLEVSFRISTGQYARLLRQDGGLVDTPVEVTLDVLGVGLTAQARLTRESAAVTEGTTGRVLYAEILDPRGLRPGDFVTVTVIEPELQDVARVPATAVNSAGRVLVLADGDRLREEDVEVLRLQGDDVIIGAASIAGEEIVAERSQLLGEGIKVRPLRPLALGEDETVELDDERRARLISFVQSNVRLSDEAKDRMLIQLQEPLVPARMVARIENRMGS